MSDDRKLVERLAAIDATPRASWVAELRADLDAAWETGDAGYLVSLRTTPLTLVDHEPTPSEPSNGRRWLILIAAAAAIVVAIAFVAARDHDTAPADQPSPTVTVPPATPRALFATEDELRSPGTYYVDEIEGTPTPARIYVTIGAGWENFAPAEPDIQNLFKPGELGVGDASGFIEFSRPDRVYLDACHVADGFHPGSVTTVDGLAAALYEQKGWVDVTAPSDITIDGHPGKTFQRAAPAVLSDCLNGFPGHMRLPSTDGAALKSWPNKDGSNRGYISEPGELETLLILDIDGTVVVITANLYTRWSSCGKSLGCSADAASDSVEFDAPTVAAAGAEFAAVLDSISIDPLTVPPTTPTTTPRQPELFVTEGEQFAPGTYFVGGVDGTPTPRIFVTIGNGWAGWGHPEDPDVRVLAKFGQPGVTPEDDVGHITFSQPNRVYLDACHSSEGFHPGPVTTLDGLVAALNEQRGWTDVTAPTDITIGRYSGKTFQRTAPAVLSDCPNVAPGHERDPSLGGGALRSWMSEDWSSYGGCCYEPGQRETLVILDIDGTVVVINANLFAQSSTADRAEFAAVLDSIRIDP